VGRDAEGWLAETRLSTTRYVTLITGMCLNTNEIHLILSTDVYRITKTETEQETLFS
jgi:hypothetical protein